MVSPFLNQIFFNLDSIECIQTINLGSKYPMTLAISYLLESKGNLRILTIFDFHVKIN